jgi:endoglucanase
MNKGIFREQQVLLVTIILLSGLALSLGGCSKHAEVTAAGDVPTSTADRADAPIPPPGRTGVFEQNRRLGRGVNLGNALEAPQEGEWGITLQEEYFDLIKDAGFDAVRIPIRWSAHAAQSAPYTIDPSFFERVDWAIDQALSRDLRAVINIHHYEEMMEGPEEHKERFLALWKQIADHYKGSPADLLFEVLNEPNSGLGASTWNKILVEAINTIRDTNPNRTIIVGPGNWNNVGMLGFLELPEDDDNIIVTVHYYDPFQFTHQGAEWVDGSNPWLGTPWQGTPAEEKAITRALDAAASWAEKHNRPIFLGEFGAYSTADMDSRARWTSFVARQAEERGMSWAYWEFGAGFGVYNRAKRAWNTQILDALVPQEQ